MGSSRAAHHYVPELITEKLGMSCFNAGQDGNGIILQYGRWKMISERYYPKLIIYDLTFGYDIAQNDNMTYLDRLKPFSYDKTIRAYITGLFPVENLKLFSKMYCFNYKFLEILSDLMREEVTDGYLPITSKMKLDREYKSFPFDGNKVDDIKLNNVEKLVEECNENGVKLVFVVSPSYLGGDYDVEAFEPIRKISVNHNIPFYYYCDSEISNDANLFSDPSHLNDEGARTFTCIIAEAIKKL